ncbi:MAG: hypothetical protein JWM09_1026 [Francisellaceae bacterium]|nr:hypothetical protein [Francisellaceae bacterium]
MFTVQNQLINTHMSKDILLKGKKIIQHVSSTPPLPKRKIELTRKNSADHSRDMLSVNHFFNNLELLTRTPPKQRRKLSSKNITRSHSYDTFEDDYHVHKHKVRSAETSPRHRNSINYIEKKQFNQVSKSSSNLLFSHHAQSMTINANHKIDNDPGHNQLIIQNSIMIDTNSEQGVSKAYSSHIELNTTAICTDSQGIEIKQTVNIDSVNDTKDSNGLTASINFLIENYSKEINPLSIINQFTTPIRVAVIEDTQTARKVINRMLINPIFMFNDITDSYVNTAEAEEAIRLKILNKEKPYDWIITDIDLGANVLKGHQFIDKLLSDPLSKEAYQNCIIIFQSEGNLYLAKEWFDTKQPNNTCYFFDKPFSKKHLKDICEKQNIDVLKLEVKSSQPAFLKGLNDKLCI